MFIKLTNQVTGLPIWVNPTYITYVDQIASGGRIILVGGTTKVVKEIPETIVKQATEFEFKAPEETISLYSGLTPRD